MWWLLGCCLPLGNDVEPHKEPDEAPLRHEVDEVHVHASNLRLRPEPRSDTRRWSTLAINTKVRIVHKDGEWLEVATRDGRTGFVHGDFVGPAPLTMALVRDRIAAAGTAEARLTWWQRAAALGPNDGEVLGGLADAYRHLGREKEALAVEKVRAAGGGGIAGWFPAHHERFAPVSEALAKAKTADALIAAWREARTLLRELDEPMSARFNGDERTWAGGEDPEAMLSSMLPFAVLTYYGEGTVPALELRSTVFIKHAARTTETWDDQFFKVVTEAYDNAGGGGWASWQERNWDYGGCSPFGNGKNLHLQLLLRSDALIEEANVPELATEIRQGLLADIRQPSEEFPYCSVETSDRTPTAGLVAEAKEILEQVALSPEARAEVQARVNSNFGR